jgi:hypothetical protein
VVATKIKLEQSPDTSVWHFLLCFKLANVTGNPSCPLPDLNVGPHVLRLGIFERYGRKEGLSSPCNIQADFKFLVWACTVLVVVKILSEVIRMIVALAYASVILLIVRLVKRNISWP